MLAALLAIGVVLGFVALRATHDNNASRSSASSSSTTVPPTTSTTQVQHVAPPPVASTTTTTSSPQRQATTSTSTLCTPSDVSVSASASGSGSVVEVSTFVDDIVSCTFDPQGAGNYPCPSNVVVVQSGGGQVWPAPGQREQCSPPAAQILRPGDRVSLQATWPEQVGTTSGGTEPAPPGNYQVLGTWSWAAGSGQTPYQVQAYSASFYVS